ncbi:MAG: N-acetyltransferase [Vicinamibacterales bacterium]
MLTISDWRDVGPEAAMAMVDAEAERWRIELAWHVRDAWKSIESARVAGTLRGLVASNAAGETVGWTCFMLHHRSLQVAMLVATSPAVTAALIDGIATTREFESAALCAVCVRDGAPGLDAALAQRGFATVTYRYMQRPLGRRGAAREGLFGQAAAGQLGIGVTGRAWRLDDLDETVALCSSAYPDTRQDIRAFAPLGSEEEWRDYIMSLVMGPGCGLLVSAASLVAEGPDGGLDGVLLTTDLGVGTGHIAQVAVDPHRQGTGIGSALVVRAVGVLEELGFSRATLLVSAENFRAGRVYERLGFDDRSSFVVAVNPQPRRFSRLALASGGASTRL